MTTRDWMNQWSSITRERAVALGYPSVTAFVRAFPTSDLMRLAGLLSRVPGDTNAKYLLHLMREEAWRDGSMNDFARISLARSIRAEMSLGWGVDQGRESHQTAEWLHGTVLLDWLADLPRADEAQAERVFEALCAIPPPTGWLPENDEDPLLLRAFAGATFGAEPRTDPPSWRDDDE